MFKKGLEKAAKIILVACLGVLVYSCTAEDGKDGTNGIEGPAGSNGANGSNGTNGSNGANGSNGIGFEEMTKYGTITTTLSGKTPSGKVFNQTDVFKFTEANAGGSTVSNDVNSLEFSLGRGLDVQLPNGSATGTVVYLGLYNIGTPEERKEFYNGFNGLALKTDNLTFFRFNDDFDNINGENSNITNLNIEGYSYDEATNRLKFSFSYTVAADKNNTDHILTVSGKVDVLVLKQEWN